MTKAKRSFSFGRIIHADAEISTVSPHHNHPACLYQVCSDFQWRCSQWLKKIFADIIPVLQTKLNWKAITRRNPFERSASKHAAKQNEKRTTWQTFRRAFRSLTLKIAKSFPGIFRNVIKIHGANKKVDGDSSQGKRWSDLPTSFHHKQPENA